MVARLNAGHFQAWRTPRDIFSKLSDEVGLPDIPVRGGRLNCGSVTLRTRNHDHGAGVLAWFAEQGLKVLDFRMDPIREPEIRLTLTQNGG